MILIQMLAGRATAESLMQSLLGCFNLCLPFPPQLIALQIVCICRHQTMVDSLSLYPFLPNLLALLTHCLPWYLHCTVALELEMSTGILLTETTHAYPNPLSWLYKPLRLFTFYAARSKPSPLTHVHLRRLESHYLFWEGMDFLIPSAEEITAH